MSAADVVFDIVARNKAADGFDSAAKGADNLSSKLGSLAKGAAALVGGAAVTGFFKGAIDGATESAKVMAQSEAVIKSTGGAANITAKQMGDLAGAIARKTGVDDEAIQSAQNLLATFTNVKNGVGAGNDVFNQATKTLVDMGAALGTDAKDSAVQLGKALNDPIAGISALSRVGVTFTDQQKEQIRTMVEAGNVAGAQKVILNELGKEFGGSAEAQATATKKLGVVFGDLQEQVGGLLVPVLEKLAATLSAAITWFVEAPGPVKGAIVAVAALAAGLVILNTIQGAVTAVQALFTAGTIAHTVATTAAAAAAQVWAGVQGLLNVVLSANPIGLVVLAIAALVGGIVLAYQHSDTFRAIVDRAFRTAADAVGHLWATAKVVFAALADLFLNFTPLGQFIQHFSAIKDVAVGVFDAIKSTAAAAFRFIANNVLNPIISGINQVIRGLNIINPGRDIPRIPTIEARANGGPAVAFHDYLVGERGPELLRMGATSGTVIPLAAPFAVPAAAPAGPAGPLVEVRIDGNVYGVEHLDAVVAAGVRRGITDSQSELGDAMRAGVGSAYT